ncbi:MAG: GntR family transcriptional regulator [Rubrivivax sp.]
MRRSAKQERLRRELLQLVEQAADGARLPAERELAGRLGVARETLRASMRALQEEGLLQRRQGSGTFVVAQAWVKPFQLRSFSEDMRERGLQPSSRVLSVREVPADAKLAHKLRLSPGAALHEVRRLRLADRMPMALETAYLPVLRLPGLDPQVLAEQSLYELLAREYGIHMRAAAQQIEATVLTHEEARLLDVAPFSPALLVERAVQSASGEPIEFGKSLYRADRYRLEVEVLRASAGEPPGAVSS